MNTDLFVVGLDEAGLGPLAGPIIFAAVGIPATVHMPWANDSKKLSDDERFEAAVKIQNGSPYVQIVEMGVATIEALGAGPVWDSGFSTVISTVLQWPPARIIVDGKRRIRGLPRSVSPEYIVKADAKYKAVGAASIVAKCRQVVEMDNLDSLYPAYGFSKHRGYGTPDHVEAIRKYGAVRGVHRKVYVESVAAHKGFRLRWRDE